MTTCPECGEKSIKRVRSGYTTEDGRTIKRLARWQCSSCGANFFDIEAARRVVSEGQPVKRRVKAAYTAVAAK